MTRDQRLRAIITNVATYDNPNVLTISHAAAQVIGLDDAGRYPDVARDESGRTVILTGTRDALLDLVTELYDRATEGPGGFDEAPAAKAVCRRAFNRAVAAGYDPFTARPWGAR